MIHGDGKQCGRDEGIEVQNPNDNIPSYEAGCPRHRSPPHPLPTPPLILLIAKTQPPALLLVPGAQALAAERQVLVLDDAGGLYPGVQGGQVVVICRRGRGCGG